MDQHPEDPQSWNLYGYARNNPLRYGDPSGEAIELVGDEKERDELLRRFQSAAGDEKGRYLYVNEHKGKFYLGIYANGKDGKQKVFSEALGNEASKAIARQIGDEKSIAAFQLGDRLQQGPNVRNLNSANPGETFLTDPTQNRTMTYLARSTAVDDLPATVMANGLPGRSNAGLVALHELGHAIAKLAARSAYTIDLDKTTAVNYENFGRKTQRLPLRLLHDPPWDKNFGR